jgi:hypothetical protein
VERKQENEMNANYNRKQDLYVVNHGSLFTVVPKTKSGAEWLRDTSPEDAQFFGAGMVVEPRYVLDVVEAAREAGLVVS